MRESKRINCLLVVVLVASTAGVALTPTTVTNKLSSTIQIIPLDQAHRSDLPRELGQSPSIPPGAFLLKNLTDIPITAVVVRWSYLGRDGLSQQGGVNCDGYAGAPTWIVVRAKDFAFITPRGCNKRERLSPGTLLSPLDLQVNTDLIAKLQTASSIAITIDSVIFEDGKIWGPDKEHYYRKIAERFNAAKAVTEEIASAKAAGEDIRSHATRIASQPGPQKDGRSSWVQHYASVLAKSPNPEGTLRAILDQPPLPEFHHIGEE
jgi:hypothetical protein